MAVPRVFSQSRSLLSRGFATSRVATVASRSIRPAFSQRSFTSSATFLQEVAQTPATGSEAPSKATSDAPAESTPGGIALHQLPRRAVKSEIQDLLRSEGFEIKEMQLRLDRFTFKNDTKCFIQLANDHQAQEAIQRLNNAKLHGKPISVKPLGAGFQWSRPDRAGKDRETSRSFFQFNEEGNEVAEALKPLLEGRRCILRVQPPGWGSKQGTMSKNKAARQVVNKYMGQFGIEVVGGMSAFFGDKRDEPRLLCIIDFATKEGAEAAIKAINNTVIEDRRTLLEVSKMAPWRAHQVGLVDQKLLKQLQEADLASQKTYPDKYPVSSSVPIEKKM